MARGFTDSSGKFRPTGNNGTSSRSKSTKAEGMKMMKVLNIDNPLAESNPQRKQEAMLEKLDVSFVKLSNREIDWIKNTINRESKPAERSDFADEVLNKLADHDGVDIDETANSTGEEFLKRKPIFNGVLGERERAVVENFDEFKLIGFHDSGNQFHSFYVPLWRAISTDGDSFEYFFSGGEINITG